MNQNSKDGFKNISICVRSVNWWVLFHDYVVGPLCYLQHVLSLHLLSSTISIDHCSDVFTELSTDISKAFLHVSSSFKNPIGSRFFFPAYFLSSHLLAVLLLQILFSFHLLDVNPCIVNKVLAFSYTIWHFELYVLTPVYQRKFIRSCSIFY